MPRITEAEIADAVEAILKVSLEGRATIAQLSAEIPAHIALSAEDLGLQC
jgi:hypothetical protein